MGSQLRRAKGYGTNGPQGTSEHHNPQAIRVFFPPYLAISHHENAILSPSVGSDAGVPMAENRRQA